MPETNYPVLDATMKAIANLQDQPWNLKIRNQFQVLEQDLFNLGQRDQANLVNRYVTLMDNGLTVEAGNALKQLDLKALPTHPLATASVSDKKPIAGQQIIEAQVVENKRKFLPSSKGYTPVETIGNHPIYETTSLEDALKINQEWKNRGSKFGTKPRFRYLLENPTKDSGLYGFQEIETNAASKSGFRFKKVTTLLSTSQAYRERVRQAGITDNKLFKIYQEEFPEAPKKEIDALVKFFRNQDKFMSKELNLKKLEWERLYGKKFAIDHLKALASGEQYTGVYTNKAVIEHALNSVKSASQKAELLKFLKDQGIDTPKNRILRSLWSDLEFDRPGSDKINRTLHQIFNKDSPTYNNFKGKAKIGGTVFASLNALEFLVPGDTSAAEFQKAIHHGGSMEEAWKTYGKEKTGQLIGIGATAPAFMALSKIPAVGAAIPYTAPIFIGASLIHAADKFDDIFLDGATKRNIKRYDPGEAIETGRQQTAIPGDHDFKNNSYTSSKYTHTNVIQGKDGKYYPYNIPNIK